MKRPAKWGPLNSQLCMRVSLLATSRPWDTEEIYRPTTSIIWFSSVRTICI
jgi:hypothetical protein